MSNIWMVLLSEHRQTHPAGLMVNARQAVIIEVALSSRSQHTSSLELHEHSNV